MFIARKCNLNRRKRTKAKNGFEAAYTRTVLAIFQNIFFAKINLQIYKVKVLVETSPMVGRVSPEHAERASTRGPKPLRMGTMRQTRWARPTRECRVCVDEPTCADIIHDVIQQSITVGWRHYQWQLAGWSSAGDQTRDPTPNSTQPLTGQPVRWSNQLEDQSNWPGAF